MASITIHTGILTSPKHVVLSDGAFRLWVLGLCWSKEHLTDGFIPEAMLPSLHRQAKKHTTELLAVVVAGKGPLWEKTQGGYRIHDYTDWQETSDAVQTRRRKWRAAKRGSSPASTVESTPESTQDSSGESREGSGSGVGSGGGRGGGGGDTPRAIEATGVPDDPYLSDPGEMPTRRRKAHIAWESRRGLDVPHELHDELLRRMADPDDGVLRRWYGETEREWQGRAVGDTCWQFWRARFREWQGTTVTPITTRKADTAGWADGLVAGGGR